MVRRGWINVVWRLPKFGVRGLFYEEITVIYDIRSQTVVSGVAFYKIGIDSPCNNSVFIEPELNHRATTGVLYKLH